MIKTKDGYIKLISTTYSGSADYLLQANGGAWAVHTGRNDDSNKIVRTDASGYLQTGWINTTSGDMGTTAITRIYCSSDGFIRYKTPDDFFSLLANDNNQLSITVGSQNRKLTINYSNYSGYSNYLAIHDIRGTNPTPNDYDDEKIKAWFNKTGTPNSDWWSGITVKGWTDGYAVWQLAGYSSTTSTESHLYYRRGLGTSWGSWRTVLDSLNYTTYVKKLGTADVGTTNRPIYLDAGVPTALSATKGSASLPVYLSAGSIVACTASSIFSNLSNSENNISITIAGQNRTLTVGYASTTASVYTGSISGNNHASALQSYFNSYKSSIPRNKLISFYSSAYNNGSQGFGYFLSGYDTTPYGGFFIAHYNTPRYVGIQYGSYSEQVILTNTNYTSYVIKVGTETVGSITKPIYLNAGSPEECSSSTSATASTIAVRDGNGDLQCRLVRSNFDNQNTISGALAYRVSTTDNYIRFCSNIAAIRSWLGVATSSHTHSWESITDKPSGGSSGQAVYINKGNPIGIDWRIGNSSTGEHNANNINYNFCGYYSSNGPSTSLGASTGDGALYSQAYSSNWVGQIAQDYRNGALFVRGKNNNVWQSWRKILDSSNYTSILDGRYVNVTGDTMTGKLSWSMNGVTSSISNGNSSYTHYNTDASSGHWFNKRVYVAGDIYAGSSYNQKVWHAGNDGSNSGLDADLLDGKHASAFSLSGHTHNYITTNYIGGQKTDPQIYFGPSIGVKVAMTGLSSKGTSYWNDTLWINGYAGGDVAYMCALHFNRDGTPNMFISSQKHNATSYGTLYKVWTSYNFDPSDYSLVGHTHNYAPSSHTHTLSQISDLHSSWDAILKAAPSAYVTRWPSWSEVTGKPSTFTPSSHTHPYLPLAGGTMNSGATIKLSGTSYLIQNQNSTSNYTTILKWYKGGESQASYDPQIGQHNTGGDGTGSIVILPYATDTSPWGGSVGLFIAKNTLKLDGKSIAFTSDIPTVPTVTNYYWANIKVSASSSTSTSPTFATATMTRGVVGGYNNTSYALSTSSFVCNSWVRTNGAAGWYSQTYGGGIYMKDSTYVRTYASKKFYAEGGYLAPYTGGQWIAMATRDDIISGNNNQTTGTAHGLFRVKNSDGDAIVFGGLGKNVGFYGFSAKNISSNNNSTSWTSYWDVSTGDFHSNHTITSTGFKMSGSSNSYVLLGGGSHKNLADFLLKTNSIYLGTTSVPLNRASGTLTLNGVNIEGYSKYLEVSDINTNSQNSSPLGLYFDVCSESEIKLSSSSSLVGTILAKSYTTGNGSSNWQLSCSDGKLYYRTGDPTLWSPWNELLIKSEVSKTKVLWAKYIFNNGNATPIHYYGNHSFINFSSDTGMIDSDFGSYRQIYRYLYFDSPVNSTNFYSNTIVQFWRSDFSVYTPDPDDANQGVDIIGNNILKIKIPKSGYFMISFVFYPD